MADRDGAMHEGFFLYKCFYSVLKFQFFCNCFGFIINLLCCIGVGFFVRSDYIVLQQFVICTAVDFVHVDSFISRHK